ncbi:bifunctional hydroxymethylpyrimidine kinase/phosphomethylpyrimidine kinase [Litorimonas sp. RW-G-Af-16]|uniref:bifunctional hydroxymethylpyrimidine kinase/phosphomethylpyrimidine kinase n=1 Tax=Litorimonas sp. RW-G-Af-16 TaxID=3241168 RepID=UPI00390C6051
MKTVLVISSFVAASRVGATASAFCLRRLGHDAIILPTTLMGRHPGWGHPGGGATDVETLAEMWAAIKDQNIQIDAVLSGYMGDTAHILFAAEVIRDVKAANPDAMILVDPVMGDHGRLYIPEARAQLIAETLLPLADIITPNQWEWEYMTKQIGAKISCNVLITSVEVGEAIGAQYIGQNLNMQVSHPKFDAVPHGGGDALAGLFLGHSLNGKDAVTAMGQAVAGVFKIMEAANKYDAGELPLIRTQEAWVTPFPLATHDLKDDTSDD